MADRRLAVWCFGQVAGVLIDETNGLRFAYDRDWVATAKPPLSHSLPLDGDFTIDAARAFFGGLLPEAGPRELVARELGVSAGNDFGLLAALGGDTAGALSFLPMGASLPPAEGDVEWLDDQGLAALLDEIPTRPMHVDSEGEYRLSLAGAQDKLPVVVDGTGRIGLTRGGAPSTHILKTPIQRLADTVVNEAFCPALGRALGVDTVLAEPRQVGGREFLLIARYDRVGMDGDVVRLHQEDFCQALGIPTSRKYEAEGGPSFADCFALLREAVGVPATELLKLLDYIGLNWLIGNHDAHGKNLSLLYVPDYPHAVLAPAYDLLSTVAYHRAHNLTRKMAMEIGGEYRPEYVRVRHLERLLAAAGLGPAAARRRLQHLAQRAPEAARAVRGEMAEAGWDRPILDTVIEIVDRRAADLLEMTAAAR